jgi:hypothetical protein
MGLISEYLTLIGKGVKNFDKIVEGIYNEKTFNSLSDEIKDVIADRTVKCAECPFNSINAKLSEEYFKLFGEHYISERRDSHCAICGCLLKYKIPSLSSNCGLEIYNANNKNNLQPLKWKAYEKK